ncbi:bladder cancer associated transcript 1 isoform X1 [Prinia subflava]|uniref:bladder cancer associated transcript 1 isoform X1 n=1 Tax=Prinia subflava TaxID=208062 RepID=UPI002FE1C9D5
MPLCQPCPGWHRALPARTAPRCQRSQPCSLLLQTTAKSLPASHPGGFESLDFPRILARKGVSLPDLISSRQLTAADEERCPGRGREQRPELSQGQPGHPRCHPRSLPRFPGAAPKPPLPRVMPQFTFACFCGLHGFCKMKRKKEEAGGGQETAV